jgi:predicted DCC family thiol-disulfide oxidoreductase YuxK
LPALPAQFTQPNKARKKVMPDLTIYYDALCPLCRMEIQHLEKLDTSGRLRLEDINASDFTARYPHIDPVAADRILHGETGDGQLIFGLDVTCLAWKLVGKGHWFAFLRWPIVSPIADGFYYFFAKHRHRISSWFGRPQTCDQTCDLSCDINSDVQSKKVPSQKHP